jgi:hypothetical protein
MAMSASGMANSIYDKMDEAYPGMGNGSGPTKEYLETLAKGIIEHLKDNLEVLPGTFANQAGNILGVGKVQ